ncbi:MAG: AAA family ATPase, partial [Thermoplasmata archaeon]|nr:AAA family ATPase [Thermoplasmata archaeon]NIT75355.1 AAA family ATPase [Thermoplasmata archaeon]NIU47535.1 AAA family ATPase [Thermoplasmata archaeon]NIV77191.1 AAA family ATPase [Thermoplasmata archaeon]NIY01726.1 AAA family ATPase [Thermoplasmata archaeon]
LRDFIQKGGLTVVYGEPGGGKSLVIQAWANILAAPGSSWAWVGRERAHRAEVLYIMAEGQGGLRGRLLAWQEHRAVEFLPGVRWMMSPFEVWRPPQEREFTEQQQEMLRYIEQEGIEVVFIDTLAATFGGGNENAQQDMNQYLQMCAAMQALGASVVIAHHAAKGSKTVRGSTVLHGAADTVILLDPNRSETTSEILSTELKLKKQKDGTPFAPITLRPKVYKVDTKAGESLVLHPGERDATV